MPPPLRLEVRMRLSGVGSDGSESRLLRRDWSDATEPGVNVMLSILSLATSARTAALNLRLRRYLRQFAENDGMCTSHVGSRSHGSSKTFSADGRSCGSRTNNLRIRSFASSEMSSHQGLWNSNAPVRLQINQ